MKQTHDVPLSRSGPEEDDDAAIARKLKEKYVSRSDLNMLWTIYT